MKLPVPKPLRDAETDLVWVIVPFSRPENLDHVLANFQRQKFPLKKLVLVENGRAAGAASALVDAWRNSSALMVLTSEAHQSAAKNVALHEIRKRGGGFTVVMDDDDWYGPQYLTEAAGYARSYDIIGKSQHFVSADGSLWLCKRELANTPGRCLTGGTIACWAESAPEYPIVKDGEDALFCQKAHQLGMKIFGTDLYHYLYRRESRQDHAWRISIEDFRRYESASGALDLGAEDLTVVCGLKREVEAKHLDPAEHIDTLVPPLGAAHVTA